MPVRHPDTAKRRRYGCRSNCQSSTAIILRTPFVYQSIRIFESFSAHCLCGFVTLSSRVTHSRLKCQTKLAKSWCESAAKSLRCRSWSPWISSTFFAGFPGQAHGNHRLARVRCCRVPRRIHRRRHLLGPPAISATTGFVDTAGVYDSLVRPANRAQIGLLGAMQHRQ
jgi:hypothetical protein